ncbi:MAG: alpha-glucoside transport system substrate-binding protein [Actinomycetota bacterium]|nr:alpha-glucoside transport system substrate-binding protein [Actinomycetota bacterium]
MTLALAACGVGGSSGSSASGAGGSANNDPACAAYKEYGSFSGKTVNVFTSILAPEDAQHKKSYEEFEKCTGIKIKYEGSSDFEAALKVRTAGGNAPDLAYIPQPGLLGTLVKQGVVKAAPKSVEEKVDKNWTPDWKKYGTVDGKFYAAPLGASVKSLVWYSPSYFKANSLTVPETWADMLKLSDTIAAKGIKPWCAGFQSGAASGWPGTDWIEDVLLRTGGAEVYDKWVSHEIPFNDPQVVAAFDKVGEILKSEKYVNGGYGNVKTINTVRFQDGGLTIPKAQCALHRMASFYAAQWDKSLKIDKDGDIFAFYLPAIDPSSDAKKKPVLGAGEFVAAFSDKPEVQAFQSYLASPEWANAKAKLGGWASANKGLKVENVADPIQKLSVELLQDPNATFRFDGSDMMPAAVGSGTFWTAMVNFINGQSTQQVTGAVEASWPKS